MPRPTPSDFSANVWYGVKDVTIYVPDRYPGKYEGADKRLTISSRSNVFNFMGTGYHFIFPSVQTKNMKLQESVIRRLESKLGTELHSPAAVERLSLDILSATGERLSANTLKRLVGLLPYNSSPRLQTLDILASYLGCDSWEMLQRDVADEISCFGASARGIYATDLKAGNKIELLWSPGRRVVIEFKGDGRFVVVESEGAKIIKGDTVCISHLVKGFPLMASDVVRAGKSLGNYTAALESGIERIELIYGSYL